MEFTHIPNLISIIVMNKSNITYERRKEENINMQNFKTTKLRNKQVVHNIKQSEFYAPEDCTSLRNLWSARVDKVHSSKHRLFISFEMLLSTEISSK